MCIFSRLTLFPLWYWCKYITIKWLLSCSIFQFDNFNLSIKRETSNFIAWKTYQRTPKQFDWNRHTWSIVDRNCVCTQLWHMRFWYEYTKTTHSIYASFSFKRKIRKETYTFDDDCLCFVLRKMLFHTKSKNEKKKLEKSNRKLT